MRLCLKNSNTKQNKKQRQEDWHPHTYYPIYMKDQGLHTYLQIPCLIPVSTLRSYIIRHTVIDHLIYSDYYRLAIRS